MPKRRLKGVIVSDTAAKTVVVKVERIVAHPKYLRRMKLHERYKAHDEQNEYKTGERVIIEESKPISKDKRWKVVGRVDVNAKTAAQEQPTPEEVHEEGAVSTDEK